ncbi:hypothetical protein LSAT2_005933, partial [Lamellibrachia satsuma]
SDTSVCVLPSVVTDAHLYVTGVVIGDINSSVNENPVIHCSVPADNSSQTPHWLRLSIEELSNDPKMLQYYSGLQSSSSGNYMLQSLGPAAHHLEYRWTTTCCRALARQFISWSTGGQLHAAEPWPGSSSSGVQVDN